MRRSRCCSLLCAAPLAAKEALDPEAQRFVDSLHPRSGAASRCPKPRRTLELGTDYVFYGREDARAILVQAWGNPPEMADGVLGLVMPAGTTPLSDSWGAVVTYQDTGHVADDDAAEADYDQILADLREASAARNKERRDAGYAGVEVLGWAETPTTTRPATRSSGRARRSSTVAGATRSTTISARSAAAGC